MAQTWLDIILLISAIKKLNHLRKAGPQKINPTVTIKRHPKERVISMAVKILGPKFNRPPCREAICIPAIICYLCKAREMEGNHHLNR